MGQFAKVHIPLMARDSLPCQGGRWIGDQPFMQRELSVRSSRVGNSMCARARSAGIHSQEFAPQRRVVAGATAIARKSWPDRPAGCTAPSAVKRSPALTLRHRCRAPGARGVIRAGNSGTQCSTNGRVRRCTSGTFADMGDYS